MTNQILGYITEYVYLDCMCSRESSRNGRDFAESIILITIGTVTFNVKLSAATLLAVHKGSITS